MSTIELLAASPAFFIGACLVLGLLVGSFLNVVIYRLPLILERQWREQCEQESAGAGAAAAAQTTSAPEALLKAPAGVPERFNLIVPRSACPVCRAPIGALQNIPLLSFLILGGKCAHCSTPIGIRYPLVEALTGILSALVAWQFGFGWAALGALLLTWFLVALTFIDIDHQLLPDSLTLPLLWLGLFASLWTGQAGAAALPVDSRSSLIGAMAGYVSLWSVYHLFRLVTGKEGMGYGDFKFLAALGAWLGWQMLLPVILIAAAVGAVVGILLISLRGHSRATPIPFGPFLAAAGWLMLMFGQPLVAKYLGLFASY
ncbi:MAG TPA: A24 family peptidase [Steroidobacteraceae bacterium]|nr:A24 family peptidase [Steroidobacteraceae bacterium]